MKQRKSLHHDYIKRLLYNIGRWYHGTGKSLIFKGDECREIDIDYVILCKSSKRNQVFPLNQNRLPIADLYYW